MKKILALALTALVLLSICSLSVADEKKTLTGSGFPSISSARQETLFPMRFLEWLVRCF